MHQLSSLVRQVRFRESWRGYNPGDVDAYVKRVEQAVSWAQSRMDTLEEHAETPETHETDERHSTDEAADASAESAADRIIADACQRAEQIVAEAESRAEATVAGADEEGLRIRREADEHAESMFADLETRAKDREAASAAAERKKYASEISELVAERARLTDDLKLLEHHVAQRRRSLEESLSELAGLLKSSELVRTVDPPSARAADPGAGDTASDDVGGSDSRQDDSAVDTVSGSTAATTGDSVGPDASTALDDGFEGGVEPLLREDTGSAVNGSDDLVETGHGQPRFVTAADLEERQPLDEPVVDEPVEPRWNDGAPDSPRSSLVGENASSPQATPGRREEPFLAQLREAASRDRAGMDTDDALSAFFNQEEDQRRPPWFLGGR